MYSKTGKSRNIIKNSDLNIDQSFKTVNFSRVDGDSQSQLFSSKTVSLSAKHQNLKSNPFKMASAESRNKQNMVKMKTSTKISEPSISNKSASTAGLPKSGKAKIPQKKTLQIETGPSIKMTGIGKKNTTPLSALVNPTEKNFTINSYGEDQEQIYPSN